jgi:hypothetical protein
VSEISGVWLVLWLIIGVVALIHNGTVYSMLFDINKKLAEDDQLSMFWWYPTKTMKIFRLHKQFYPESSLRTVSMVSGFGLLAIMVCLTLFIYFINSK